MFIFSYNKNQKVNNVKNYHRNHPHMLSTQIKNELKIQTSMIDKQNDMLNLIRLLTCPTKLKIISILQKLDEITVQDLTEIIGTSQSAVSHALSDLKNLNIVTTQKCGKYICYRINNKAPHNQIISFMKKINIL